GDRRCAQDQVDRAFGRREGAVRRIARAVHSRVALSALLAAALVALAGTPASAELGPNSCGWATRIGADQLNVAFPDTAAEYWIAAVPMPPGGFVEVSGNYPHARYTSIIDYTAAAQSIDGLADVQIQPDPGSTNPFDAGADRTASQRSYAVKVVNGAVPAGAARAPNTIYSTSPDGTRPSPPGPALLIY